MFSILEFGTIFNFIFLIVVFLILGNTIDNNDEDLRYVPYYVVLISFALLYIFGGGKTINEVFNLMLAEKLKTIGSIFAYILWGVIWSFYKWQKYIKYKIKKITSVDFYGRKDERINELLDVTKHKTQIVKWISFWPISMSWSLFKFFTYDIFNWVFDSIKSTYKSFVERELRSNNLLNDGNEK